MSHKATHWAFEQPRRFPDMMPNEWCVLLVLADCHNPVKGCFPSHQYICQQTNLSERSVRDQLNRLRERELIAWNMVRESGHRGANRYRMAFEAEFQPASSAGSPSGKIKHDLPANHAASNRQDLPPNPVIEPVSESKRECSGEEIEAFEAARKAWPTGFADSREDALAAWRMLSAADQRVATAEIGRYMALTKSIGRKFFGPFADYLGEQKWRALPDLPKSASRSIAVRERSAPAQRKPTSFQRKYPELYPELFVGAGEATKVAQRISGE